MPRQMSSSTGLRRLLIEAHQESWDRWRVPGMMSDFELDLKAGRPVVVSSAQILSALMRAGLPYRDFAYGGSAWGKTFVLDERDELSELQGR
jgi:hypothetical protein